MPKYYEYYQDRPSVGKAFSESFSRNWERSLENEMEEKRKNRDLDLQLTMAGGLPEDEYKKRPELQDPEIVKYTRIVKMPNKTWYIPPTNKDIAEIKDASLKRQLELEKLRNETIPLADIIAQLKGGSPSKGGKIPGVKVTRGGVTVDLGEESPEEKSARSRQEKLSDPNYIMQLRKEFGDQPIVKDFDTLGSQFKIMKSSVNSALKQGTNDSKLAADQAIIMTFNKILDPRGTVREGEYARTSQGQSLMNRIEGYARQLGEGGSGLTDKDRKDILNVTADLVRGTQKTYQAEREYYKGFATKYGIEPEDILGRDKSLREEDYILENQAAPQVPNFASEEDAIRANLKPGTVIMIRGRKAVWE